MQRIKNKIQAKNIKMEELSPEEVRPASAAGLQPSTSAVSAGQPVCQLARISNTCLPPLQARAGLHAALSGQVQ